MFAKSTKTGGRPPTISEDDIVRVGRTLGMRRLSMSAVAAELGVSATALYRHVDGRWGLECLVGESLLSQLQLQDEGDDPVRHLLSFALQLRAHVLRHPGLARYLQTLFPRGEGGRRLLAAEIEALARLGYAPDSALVLCGAVASTAIGYAAAEDEQRERADELSRRREDSLEQVLNDSRLRDAHSELPEIDSETYTRLMLTGVIVGLVQCAPPGRPVAEIIHVLRTAGEGR